MKNINSKERVISTCDHISPDKIPVDFWATDSVINRLIDFYGLKGEEELLETLNIDFRYISGPKYTGPSLEVLDDGSKRDIWGVPRKVDFTETGEKYSNVTRYPLKDASTVKEIEEYSYWPSPDWFDYEVAVEQCEKYPQKAVIYSGGRLNRTSQLKAAIYLRSMEKIMEDMYLNPKLLEALLDQIRSFYLKFNEKLFEKVKGKLDIFMMGDDFGMQDSLICKKEMWERFFRPGLEKYISLARKYDIKIMHHSCGAIKPIIPDFIEMGLDILNPIQPEASGMNPENLKKEFGQDITFHGGLSIQETLPHGTPGEVREEVKRVFNVLGKSGGFIACTAHNIQADTSLENIKALFDAYEKFR